MFPENVLIKSHHHRLWGNNSTAMYKSLLQLILDALCVFVSCKYISYFVILYLYHWLEPQSCINILHSSSISEFNKYNFIWNIPQETCISEYLQNILNKICKLTFISWIILLNVRWKIGKHNWISQLESKTLLLLETQTLESRLLSG